LVVLEGAGFLFLLQAFFHPLPFRRWCRRGSKHGAACALTFCTVHADPRVMGRRGRTPMLRCPRGSESGGGSGHGAVRRRHDCGALFRLHGSFETAAGPLPLGGDNGRRPDVLVGVLKGRQNALLGRGGGGAGRSMTDLALSEGTIRCRIIDFFGLPSSDSAHFQYTTYFERYAGVRAARLIYLPLAGAARPSGASSHTLTAALCSRMR
jgi:hypothetical protein